MSSESSTALAPLVVLRQFMDVESVYGYRKGGFHPVHIDDVPHNRHQVLHKLGHGSYGTVWLSEDLTSGRFVSVKILPANASKNVTELAILRHLQQNNDSDPGRKYVVELLDDFHIEGPNGTHQCIVTEVHGPNFSVDRECVYGQEAFPVGVAKSLVAKILRGVAFLHSKGVIHGGESMHMISSYDSALTLRLFAQTCISEMCS